MEEDGERGEPDEEEVGPRLFGTRKNIDVLRRLFSFFLFILHLAASPSTDPREDWEQNGNRLSFLVIPTRLPVVIARDLWGKCFFFWQLIIARFDINTAVLLRVSSSASWG